MHRELPIGGKQLIMDEVIWKPHTTVAALCEREGKYLLVKEEVKGLVVFNQPAGHLNPDETLLDAGLYRIRFRHNSSIQLKLYLDPGLC